MILTKFLISWIFLLVKLEMFLIVLLNNFNTMMMLKNNLKKKKKLSLEECKKECKKVDDELFVIFDYLNLTCINE